MYSVKVAKDVTVAYFLVIQDVEAYVEYLVKKLGFKREDIRISEVHIKEV